MSQQLSRRALTNAEQRGSALRLQCLDQIGRQRFTVVVGDHQVTPLRRV